MESGRIVVKARSFAFSERRNAFWRGGQIAGTESSIRSKEPRNRGSEEGRAESKNENKCKATERPDELERERERERDRHREERREQRQTSSSSHTLLFPPDPPRPERRPAARERRHCRPPPPREASLSVFKTPISLGPIILSLLNLPFLLKHSFLILFSPRLFLSAFSLLYITFALCTSPFSLSLSR